MLIIGERLNCTRKKIREAVERRDAEFIRGEVEKQVGAGADLLDVNGGIAGSETECLTWMVNVVQESTDVPICLDSADSGALEKALPLCRKRPMINSITDEPERFEGLLPLIKKYDAQIIALCLGVAGPPKAVDDRLELAESLISKLTKAGVAPEDILVDPCVFPVSTGPEYGTAVLTAVREIRQRYPEVRISGGVSNVSFGLPLRKLVNETFLVMLMSHGLDAAIVDPTDSQMMANVLAAEAILGRDDFCGNYLQAFRAGKLTG
jgi:5-methyltetrahydrofolate--homocysteine methyltransferase